MFTSNQKYKEIMIFSMYRNDNDIYLMLVKIKKNFNQFFSFLSEVHLI